MGHSLPVRITDQHLIAYDRSLSEVARHMVLQGLSGQRRLDPTHAPPRDHEEQMQRLRERFAEIGEVGVRYLQGLENKQRNSKHQAIKILGLLHAYHKSDLLKAMERAVQYYAYGFSSLERILAHQAKPKPGWQQLDESTQQSLQQLAPSQPIGPRHSQEYQNILYGIPVNDGESHDTTHQASDETSAQENCGDCGNASDRPNPSPSDPPAPSDAEDSPQ
jgi:hypothetical protein